MVELEAETRRVHEYAGSVSDYEATRARARAQHEAAFADYADERDRYTALLRDRRNQGHWARTKQTGWQPRTPAGVRSRRHATISRASTPWRSHGRRGS